MSTATPLFDLYKQERDEAQEECIRLRDDRTKLIKALRVMRNEDISNVHKVLVANALLRALGETP